MNSTKTRKMASVALAYVLLGVCVTVSSGALRASSVAFERLYPLEPHEGVFAYARVSPDGHWLAYTSELEDQATGRVTQTVTVVDVRSRRIDFREPGMDAYWSNDNRRIIFLSFVGGRPTVAIRHQETGQVVHGIAPVSLGDYFSWSVRNGKNWILTIDNNFYALDGDWAVLPASSVKSCPGIGTGSRPLISKNGQRATTFVRGHVIVRNVSDCEDILDTGLQGAKADFSFDGRHVAFHVPKPDHEGFEIVIVDTQDRTMRILSGLRGSSLFPSWTEDGRLCFRYDGAEFRGFMMATNVLAAPAHPLPRTVTSLPERPLWRDLFPATTMSHRTNIVMIWSDWSAHAPKALADLQTLAQYVENNKLDVGVMTSVPPDARHEDLVRILAAHRIRLAEIPLSFGSLQLTGALNQIPTELLFSDGVLVAQRLGPMSLDQLEEWVAPALLGR